MEETLKFVSLQTGDSGLDGDTIKEIIKEILKKHENKPRNKEIAENIVKALNNAEAIKLEEDVEDLPEIWHAVVGSHYGCAINPRSGSAHFILHTPGRDVYAFRF